MEPTIGKGTAMILRMNGLAVDFKDGQQRTIAAVILATILCAWFQVACPHPGYCQPPPSADQQIADRLFQVLLRRPSPGPVLDRVVNHHRGNQTLAEFVDALDVDQGGDQSGPRQMIRGLILLEQGKLKVAIDALSKAERWMPDSADISFHLGNALSTDGQIAGGIRALERSLRRDPSRKLIPEIHLELARLHLRQSDSEAAIAIWTELMDKYPESESVTEKVARSLASENRWQLARNAYQRLSKTARSPEKKTQYRIRVIEMDERMGHDAEARKDLTSLLARLRPGSWLHTDVTRRLEESYLNAGDLKGLTEYYERLIGQSPENISVLLRLAELFVGGGEYKKAESILRRGIDRWPSDEKPRVALVDVLESSSRASEATKEMQSLCQLAPGNPDYLFSLADLFLVDPSMDLDQQRAEAAKTWERLARARSDNPVTLAKLAGKMNSIGRQDRATELYRAAIECDPLSNQHRESLGAHLQRIGKSTEAIEVWQSMAEGERQSAASLIRLAEVLRTFGHSTLAAQAWQQASTYDLAISDRLKYARFLQDTDVYDQAIEQLNQALPIAESTEDRRQVLQVRIDVFRESGQLADRIAQKMLEPETDEKQLRLAMLLQASGRTEAAQLAIERYLKVSPDDVTGLILAANIAEAMQQTETSIKLLRQLCRRDTRNQTSYLTRLVNVYQSEGRIDEAISAAAELIELNPSNSQHYLTYADLAFAEGLDSDATAMLRRSIVVAPRANEARIRLAEYYANQFRTLEALDLMWAAFDVDQSPAARESMIYAMIPLYSRRDEIPKLIGKLRGLNRKQFSSDKIEIWVAEVWNTIDANDQAVEVIERAIAANPRSELLRQRRLEYAVNANQLSNAVKQAEAIVGLSDTAANRDRLRSVQVKAGIIDERQAKLQTLAEMSNPAEMGAFIMRHAGREPILGSQLCEQALKNNPSLWDIRALQAQFLIAQHFFKPEKYLKQAERLASDVCELKLPLDTQSPALSQLRRASTNTTQPAGSAQLNFAPRFATRQGAYQLPINNSDFLTPIKNALTDPNDKFALKAAEHVIGLAQDASMKRFQAIQKNSVRRSSQYSQNDLALLPKTFEEARWIARSIRMFTRAADKDRTSDLLVGIELADPSDTDVDAIRETLRWYESAMALSVLGFNYAQPRNELIWRLVELEPQRYHPRLLLLLKERRFRQLSANQSLDPLDPNHLGTLERHCVEREKLGQNASRSLAEAATDFQAIAEFRRESRLAGNKLDDAKLAALGIANRSSLENAVFEIELAVQQKDIKLFSAGLKSLIVAARSERRTTSPIDIETRRLFAARFMTQSTVPQPWMDSLRFPLIDAWIALFSMEPSKDQRQDHFGYQEKSFVRTVVPYAFGPRQFTQTRRMPATLVLPLSERYVTAELVRGLAKLSPPAQATGRAALMISEDLAKYLKRPDDKATSRERTARALLAAFISHWNGQSYDCLEQLRKLADAHPRDVDLQIEAAYLAVINLRSKEAFERLNSIETTDADDQVRLQIAKLILATLADKKAMVAELTAGLENTNLTQTQRQAIANKLVSVQSLSNLQNPNANPSPRRITVGSNSLRTQQIAVAKSHARTISQADRYTRLLAKAEDEIKKGSPDVAGEIAFSLINQSPTRLSNLPAKFRDAALDILVKTNRLDTLIESTRLAYRNSGYSDRLREELANLYVLNGTPEKADQLWEDMIEGLQLSFREIIVRAGLSKQKRNYDQAASLYLCAFSRNPATWKSHGHVFRDMLNQSNIQPLLYQRLCKLDVSDLPLDMLCRIGKGTGDRPFHAAQRQFMSHVIASQPDSGFYIGSLLDAIPHSERALIPELHDLMVRTITSSQTYQTDCALWDLRHLSPDGESENVLWELLSMLWKDPDAADKFLRTLDDLRSSSPATRQSQVLIRSLFKMKSQEQRPEAIELISNLAPYDGCSRAGSSQLHGISS